MNISDLFFTLAHAQSQATKPENEEDKIGFLAENIEKIGLKLVYVGIAIAVIIATFILAKIIKIMTMRIFAHKYDDMSKDIISFIGRMTYLGILGIGFTIAFGIVGIDITMILGGLMVGVGFALRDILANFAAGVVILLQRQIVSGNIIKFMDAGGFKDFVGVVEDIQGRCTILRAFDGTMVIVPNVNFLTKTITNYSKNEFRRHEFIVGISYEDDLERVKQIMQISLNKHNEFVSELGSQIVLENFGDSAINFKIKFWLESQAPFVGIKSKVIQQLKKDFDENNISIPWPITTVKMEK